jgi:hypothetical protein
MRGRQEGINANKNTPAVAGVFLFGETIEGLYLKNR